MRAWSIGVNYSPGCCVTSPSPIVTVETGHSYFIYYTKLPTGLQVGQELSFEFIENEFVDIAGEWIVGGSVVNEDDSVFT